MISRDHFEWTEELKNWFGDRMDESATGAVTVPSHLYTKYRKLAENPLIPNHEIKSILIRRCYTN